MTGAARGEDDAMSLPLSEIAFHDAVDAELRGQRVAMPLAPDDPAWLRIRAEALRILEGRGSILHVALEVSRLLATAGFSTPIRVLEIGSTQAPLM